MLESKIREICQLKGLKMSDLAERIGMTQSNMVASIRNNPKLSTLNDICEALAIEMSELFDKDKVQTTGIAVINGETYTISQPTVSHLQIPIYIGYELLRKDLKKFIQECIKMENNFDNHDKNNIFGIVDGFELFSLVYDAEAHIFHLGICYQNNKVFTNQYDFYEYCTMDDKWDLNEVFKSIDNDIEYTVIERIQRQ